MGARNRVSLNFYKSGLWFTFKCLVTTFTCGVSSSFFCWPPPSFPHKITGTSWECGGGKGGESDLKPNFPLPFKLNNIHLLPPPPLSSPNPPPPTNHWRIKLHTRPRTTLVRNSLQFSRQSFKNLNGDLNARSLQYSVCGLLLNFPIQRTAPTYRGTVPLCKLN